MSRGSTHKMYYTHYATQITSSLYFWISLDKPSIMWHTINRARGRGQGHQAGRVGGASQPASKRDREKDTITTEQHTTLTQHTMIHTHYTLLV